MNNNTNYDKKIVMHFANLNDMKKTEMNYGEWYSYHCVNCGKFVRFKYKGLSRLRSYYMMLCTVCKIKAIKKEKYGDENFNNREKFIDTWNNKSPEEKLARITQIKRTNIKKYGVTNVNLLESYKNNLKNKWKCKSETERNAILERRISTVRNRHGVDFPSQLPEVRAKIDAVKRERYGDENFNNREKFIDTWNNKSPEEKLAKKIKTQQTSIRKYGKTSYLKSNKYFAKMLDKYGTEFPSFRYTFYGEFFDSSWELAVWIYCINNGIPIIRCPFMYEYEDSFSKVHKYYPDFIINGRTVEIKGNQFFKLDGTMYYPYTKLHHNSEPLTPEEKAYLDDLAERKHQCGLQHGVEFWKEEDLQLYLDYCDIKYPGWDTLYRKDNPLNPSYNCLYFINPGYYQPPYYAVINNVMFMCSTMNNGKGVSPYDIDPNEKYAPITGKGISPYDVK